MERSPPPPVLSSFHGNRAVEFISLLVSGDPELAELFKSSCEFDLAMGFIETVMPSIAKTPENLVARNVMASFLRRYKECDIDLSADFAERDLRESADQVVQFILPYLTGQKRINRDDTTTLHHLSFYLLIFNEGCPGLAKMLREKVAALIGSITDEIFFSIVGPDFLYMYDTTPPTDFMRTVSIDSADLMIWFKAQPIYLCPEFGKLMQQRVCGTCQFPAEFPGVMDGYYLSLVNSSLSCGTHFIDVIAQTVLESLTMGDLEAIPTATKGFSDLLPVLLCANQHLLYADIHTYIPALEAQYPKSLAAECLVRFKNDSRLVDLLSFVTGTDVCIADLQYVSLPKQMEAVLDRPEIMELIGLEYFSYRKDDLRADFDFIRGYKILSSFIRMVHGSQQPKATLAEIKKHIDLLSSSEVQKAIIIDMFSLLFLRHEDDTFVADRSIAMSALKMLSGYKVDKHISDGLVTVKNGGDYQTVFMRDPTELIAAIERKDWAKADRLSTGVARYRDLYLLAFSIVSVLENRTIPTECENMMDIVNLEIVFSFFAGGDLLNERDTAVNTKGATGRREDFLASMKVLLSKAGDAAEMAPQPCECIRFLPKLVAEMDATIGNLSESFGIDKEVFMSMAKTREKIRDDFIFQILPNYTAWQPLVEMILVFDSDVTDYLATNRSLPIDFSLSPTFNDFLVYLEQYFKAAMLSAHDSDAGVFDTFDFRPVISGVFNVGDIEKAHAWCTLVGVDMFDFVIENLMWFDVSQQFVDLYERTRPVEVLALCATRPGLTCAETKLFSDSAGDLQTIDERAAIDEIISSFVNGEECELEDVIYRVNPRALLERVLPLAEADFTKPGLIGLLDFVDYSAPDDYRSRLEMVRLWHAFGTKDNVVIAKGLVEAGRLDEWIDFLDKNESCRIEMVGVVANDTAKLETLLDRFPECVMVFREMFSTNLSKLDLILKYGSPDRRAYMEAVHSLPDVIRDSGDVLDSDKVGNFFLENPLLIKSVDKRAKAIVGDDMIMKILASVKDIVEYTRCWSYCISSLIDDTGRFAGVWKQRAVAFVKSIAVSSKAHEEAAIEKISVVLGKMETRSELSEMATHVELILEILRLRPYHKIGLCYNFATFGDSEKLGENLISIMFGIDAEKSLVDRCVSVFGTKLDNYLLNRCAVLIQLGLIGHARSCFNDARSTISSLCVENLLLYSDPVPVDCLDSRIPLAYLLEKNSIFDASQFCRAKIENPPESYASFEYMNRIIANEQSSSTNAKEVDYFVLECSRPWTALSMLMFRGDIQAGYKFLLNIRDLQRRSKDFITCFYKPIVSVGDINKLHKFILSQDPELSVTGHYVSSLVDFAQRRKLYYACYAICRSINREDEAMDAALNIYRTTKSDSLRMMYCGCADYSLTNALLYRREGQKCKPVYRPSDYSIEELVMRKTLIALQMKTLQMCLLLKLPFNEDFDIIFEQKAFANVGAYFYIMRQPDDADALIKTGIGKEVDVFHQLALVLSRAMPHEVSAFVVEYKKQNMELLRRIARPLLKNLSMTDRAETILMLIYEIESDDATRCELFYEFGFLGEAMLLMRGDSDILPLIAHRAAELGMLDLVERCTTVLSKSK